MAAAVSRCRDFELSQQLLLTVTSKGLWVAYICQFSAQLEAATSHPLCGRAKAISENKQSLALKALGFYIRFYSSFCSSEFSIKGSWSNITKSVSNLDSFSSYMLTNLIDLIGL